MCIIGGGDVFAKKRPSAGSAVFSVPSGVIGRLFSPVLGLKEPPQHVVGVGLLGQ
jgi:hypothetical protein